ncbi:chromodomain-helicase-DNA-binding protein 8-like isoform X4 [Pomacea canaliculata]|nr:chromodomain-helicase-DNA-binding protein 8-like isoform X4 [Pomacea canaliculata]
MSSQVASTTQPHIVQQAADSMTTDMPPPMIDSMQLTPPTVHSLLEGMPDGESQITLHGVMSSSSHLRVLTPDPLPATVTEIAEAQEGQGEKPKRKRERKPKAEKVDKPPKTPRTPKAPKTPKEPKAPKPPKEPKAPKSPRTKSPKAPKEPKTPRIRKSKKAKIEGESSLDISDTTIISMESDAKLEGETMIPTVVEIEIVDEKLEDSPKKRMLKEKKPKTPKTIVKALKKPSAKKRKPPASLFLKGKKRKRTGSDGSDVEMATTPPESPINEDSNKRRSARNTKRKKYLDDLDLNLSDDDNQPLEAVETTEGPVAMKTETEEDAMIVERILGSRMRKRDIEDAEENPSIEDEEEFLVKYKNYSFLHCEWRTLPELERDKRIHSKVKRYKLKKQQLNNYFEEPEDEEYFNPDYVEVDRVLDMVTTTDPVTKEEVTHYLVKWRSLSYEESTWELEQDVDPRKVQIFKELRTPPLEDQRQVLARPKPSQWQKLEKSQAYKGNNVLRDYQLEGLNWLTFCWYNSQNCILADEMGLGKTIQSITFLNEVYQYGIRGPFLVIVPLSTVGNWQREFETWTDMNAVVYHGTSHSRNMIQEYELFYKDENGQRIPDLFRFQALITTYEIIIADVELLSSIEWRCAIIDEAHRLKNKNCRLLEGLRLFDLEHRVLLTGTPLQNNTEELFSLLNFLNPGKFSSSQAFAKDFGELKTENQVDELKEILKPMMLRRLKEDVEKNLAPKEETIIEVELTNIQKKYYRAILERNFQFLSKGGTSSVPSLMNTMMELRKCCNHPYLINGAEEQIVLETGARGDLEHLLAAMINSSGKMVLLDKLLPRLKQNGHKVLIFSQMIRVLDIIEDYLMQKKYLFERLDGRIRGNLRQEAIDRFSKPDSDRFAFLLCTRAGGLGINLTAADTVIIYDSDWNPQNDLQAQARCHRIGQSKAVKVYRLITRNSYEREMFDKASLKLGLDKAVLQSMGGEKPASAQSQMSKKEIEDLLKKGAYGAIMDDDNAGDKFCEEDIDLILERRTKVIQIESEGKGSTFAKASFSMTSNRNDIDINDPNFWQKWAKKADLDVEALGSKNALIIEEPRQRRQTARYGKEESVVDMSDLESSSDSDSEMRFSCRKGRKSRRGRGNDDDYTYNDGISSEGYTRSDCFKVEKHLLVYGWGRWKDILAHARFKHTLMESDVQIIARAILAHSIKFYKGDERIKVFIWDLIGSSNEGELKNHTGLSAPVPRGRKGKKAKERGRCLDDCRPLDFDPEAVLDNGYKRHLHRHSNKVLLRVRLLYYIKQEVIGDQAVKVFKGVPASEIDIPTPISDGEVPAAWWDECADRCLLIGVFKHGYEKFNQVRQDPSLCFLSRCGPPDGAALLAEQNDDREDDDDMDDKILKDEDEGELSQSSVPEVSAEHNPVVTSSEEMEGGKYPFPSASDLNTRLRRVITGYQRNHKKMMMKSEQHARKIERQERAELMVKERESKKKEFQQNLLWCRHSRWSRREEADFYRTVSTFGVEFDRETGHFKWDRFRAFARLDRKYDETLTEYFHAFYYMCQSVCGKFRAEDRVPPPPNCIMVEPITEERASRCLARIDLLNKIRDEVLPHPKLAERLKLCQPSFDMPSWWQCGKHDHELLLGAARHGVSRTEYNILRDPTLSFHEILKNSGRHLRSTPQHYSSGVYAGSGAPPTQTSPAPSREIHDDDLESDAKSQDSAENRDSQTSSPPPLHSGKAQYPGTSSTDTDNEHGPPHLEPAITPQPMRDDDTQDNKSSRAKSEETKVDQHDGPSEQTAAELLDEKEQGTSNSPGPSMSVVKEEEYVCTGDTRESDSAMDSQLPVLSAAKDSDSAMDSRLPVLSASKDGDSAVDSELPVLSAEYSTAAKDPKDGVNKEEMISTEEISTCRKEHKFESAAVSADESLHCSET